MGEILGAVVAMGLFGSLAAWLVRKITKMEATPSYMIGVAAMTAIGAWLYSINSHYTFVEAWIIYAIGGVIALPIMILSNRRKQRKTAV